MYKFVHRISADFGFGDVLQVGCKKIGVNFRFRLAEAVI